MYLSYEDYKIVAKNLHSRLSQFIQSVPSATGEDFSDVYAILDANELQRQLDEFEFQVFKKRANQAEECAKRIIELLS